MQERIISTTQIDLNADKDIPSNEIASSIDQIDIGDDALVKKVLDILKQAKLESVVQYIQTYSFKTLKPVLNPEGDVFVKRVQDVMKQGKIEGDVQCYLLEKLNPVTNPSKNNGEGKVEVRMLNGFSDFVKNKILNDFSTHADDISKEISDPNKDNLQGILACAALYVSANKIIESYATQECESDYKVLMMLYQNYLLSLFEERFPVSQKSICTAELCCDNSESIGSSFSSQMICLTLALTKATIGIADCAYPLTDKITSKFEVRSFQTIENISGFDEKKRKKYLIISYEKMIKTLKLNYIYLNISSLFSESIITGRIKKLNLNKQIFFEKDHKNNDILLSFIIALNELSSFAFDSIKFDTVISKSDQLIEHERLINNKIYVKSAMVYQWHIIKFLQMSAALLIDYLRINNNENSQMIEKFRIILSKLIFNNDTEHFKDDLSKYLFMNRAKIKKLFKDIVSIFEQIVAGNFTKKLDELSKLNEQLSSLDSKIEDIYQEIGLVSSNTLKWISFYDDVSTRSNRSDFMIEVKNIEIAEMIRQFLSRKQINFVEDQTIFTISHFRKITDIQKFAVDYRLQSDYRNYLKVQKNKAKEVVNEPMKIKEDELIKNKEGKDEKTTVAQLSAFELDISTEKEVNPYKIKPNTHKKEDKTKQIQQKIERRKDKKENKKPLNKNAKIKPAKKIKDKSIAKPITTPENSSSNHTKEKTDVKLEIVVNNPSYVASFPNKKIESKLLLARHYYDQLLSAKTEMSKEDGLYNADSLTLRYYVLYHAIRLLQNLSDSLKSSEYKNTSKTITHLRNILADRMDYFLDPEETDSAIISDHHHSILSMTMRLYIFVEGCLSMVSQTENINIAENSMIKEFFSHDANKPNLILPDREPIELLNAIHHKIKNRLQPMMSKIENAHQLIDPFKEGALKMSICEIGALARQLRDKDPEYCQRHLKTDLTFRSYREELFEYLEHINNDHSKEERVYLLLPHLKKLGNQCQDFLSKLTLGEMLTLCIEVRNTIAHDTDQEYVVYPEEISAHLAFDIQKILIAKMKHLLPLLNGNKMNPLASTFAPQFLLFSNQMEPESTQGNTLTHQENRP